MAWTTPVVSAKAFPFDTDSGPNVLELPAGWTSRAQYDLVVVHVVVRGSAPIVMPTFGSGNNEWVQATQYTADSNTFVNSSGGTSASGGGVFYLIRGSSDPTNLTFSRDTSGGGTDAGMYGAVTVFRNTVTGAPTLGSAFSETMASASTTVLSTQGITTTETGELVLFGQHAARASTASSYQSNPTPSDWGDLEAYDATTTAGADMGMAVAYGNAAATTFTSFQCGASSAARHTISVVSFKSPSTSVTTSVTPYSYAVAMQNVSTKRVYNVDLATGEYSLVFNDVNMADGDVVMPVDAYAYTVSMVNVSTKLTTVMPVTTYAYDVVMNNVAATMNMVVDAYPYSVAFNNVATSDSFNTSMLVIPYSYATSFYNVDTKVGGSTHGHPVKRPRRRKVPPQFVPRHNKRGELVRANTDASMVPGITSPLYVEPVVFDFDPFDPMFQYADPAQSLEEISRMQRVFRDEEIIAMILMAK